MPFCNVGAFQKGAEVASDNGIKIFYRTYGRGPIKVLMIIGLAGTHESWGPQIKALSGTLTPNNEQSTAGDSSSDAADNESRGIEVCAFDNRGMGRSSVPTKKSAYTTTIMAKDAIAVMDHLGWNKAHIFGHSMGGMIACKLAAMVPDRVLSLALLNVTGGGYECFPKIDRQTLSVAIRFLRAKTPQQRAAVDLDTHYSQEYLDEYVGTKTRRAILYQEYVKNISATGMQSNYGFEGQINACWTHKVSQADFEAIRNAGFLISVIHGRYLVLELEALEHFCDLHFETRKWLNIEAKQTLQLCRHDIIAQLCYARRIAEKLYPSARMVELHGGHLVSHERTEEVNGALLDLIEASKKNISPSDWTNLPKESPGWISTLITCVRTKPEGASGLNFRDNFAAKLHVFLAYFFGLFSLSFEYMRRSIRSLRPVKVVPALT